MPRKRSNRSPHVDKVLEDDDDSFLFEDSQSSSGRSGHEPQHRNAANARERARMRVLSKAFCRLKTTLPWVPADTKLSKLDTLRLAASYIAHLRALLHEPRSAHTPPHPLNLGSVSATSEDRKGRDIPAWPFAFQHGGSLSCTISQRWSVNTQNCETTCEDRNPVQREIQNGGSCNDNYNQDYSENDYEERNYEEMTNEEPCNNVQYCNYGYKENYYEMRNSYSSDGLMNA